MSSTTAFADLTPAGHGARALTADKALAPLEQPTGITLAGDWHGKVGAAKFALREAAKAGSSVVVHTGDFGIWPDGNGRVFLDHVESLLGKHQLTLIFVDGNHEDFDQLDNYPISQQHELRCVRPRLYHAPRGARWNWSGLTWLALGGATSLDRPGRIPGQTWWPGEEVTWAEAQTALDGGPADVMVTHDCPFGVDIPNLPPASVWLDSELRRANQHRQVMAEVVRGVRPTHLFHGHFHSRYTAELDLGGGLSCEVTGLDRDGTQGRNIVHVNPDELAAQSRARR